MKKNDFEQYSIEATIASTDLTKLTLEFTFNSLGFLLYENHIVVSSSINFNDILKVFNSSLSISDFKNFKLTSNMIIDNDRFIEVSIVVENEKFDVTYSSFKDNNFVAADNDSKSVLASLGFFYEDN